MGMYENREFLATAGLRWRRKNALLDLVKK